MPAITILNYGVGNLRSVQKALEHVGHDATITDDPAVAAAADKLVLPGVGAFGDAMQLLRRGGFVEPIREHVAAGRPLLGICLGLQLLFDSSEEDAPRGELVKGLRVLPGEVVRFKEVSGAGDVVLPQRLKVPHMGWNALTWHRDDPLLRGVEQGAYVYFVHSYYARPLRGGITSATADYGGSFCATVWRDHVWATQFHPEKSQRVGLRILKNFAEL